jgi:hypothetical protein
MLVHAALEYLSWVTYVLGPTKRSESHHGRKDQFSGAAAATWHLQELLSDANINTAIPAGLVGMTRRADEMQLSSGANQVIDGPEVLTWLRGRLVHPKDAGEPYRIEDLVRGLAVAHRVRRTPVAAPHRLQGEVPTANKDSPMGGQRSCPMGDLKAFVYGS